MATFDPNRTQPSTATFTPFKKRMRREKGGIKIIIRKKSQLNFRSGWNQKGGVYTNFLIERYDKKFGFLIYQYPQIIIDSINIG